MKPSPLRASEVEALTFIYTPTHARSGAGSAPDANRTPHTLVRPLVGAAVALVVFVTLAWILTPR